MHRKVISTLIISLTPTHKSIGIKRGDYVSETDSIIECSSEEPEEESENEQEEGKFLKNRGS